MRPRFPGRLDFSRYAYAASFAPPLIDETSSGRRQTRETSRHRSASMLDVERDDSNASGPPGTGEGGGGVMRLARVERKEMAKPSLPSCFDARPGRPLTR